MSDKCKTCKWWGSDNREHSPSANACHALPPTVLDNTTTAGNTFMYRLPITSPGEFCSLHKPVGGPYGPE